MEHIVFSVLLVGALILTDLVPLMREKDHEKKAVWFAVPTYAMCLLINILVGCGVKITVEPAIIAFLNSLLKIKG
jgi:hypothetical protein